MNNLDNFTTIAVDAMGGDNAPEEIVLGVLRSAMNHKNIKFKIFGNKLIIEPIVDDFILKMNSKRTEEEMALMSKVEIINCEKVITNDEKPSTALRNSKGSSMRMAIEAVKNKEADASLSAGNTGALMAISKIILGTLPNIHRPAICSFVPSKEGVFTLLDMGANLECDENYLLQFATMGAAFNRAILGNRPIKIAILNIGSEEMKGRDCIKKASQILSDCPQLKSSYIGYIEPDKVFQSKCDVVVTDGFTGNIFIKASEGVASLIRNTLKEVFRSSVVSKLAYVMIKKVLKKSFIKFDHRKYNGAMFVGLNGISIKSHGSANAESFSNAIDVTISLVKNNVNEKIINQISNNSENKIK